MASALQSIIIKGFRKYSHSLGPESLVFIEEICAEHGFLDDPLQVEAAVEHLAKEYNQQEDAVTKVSLDILRRVYHSLQEKSDKIGGGEDDLLNPEDHLFFVDAFEMPRWEWSTARSSFERTAHAPTIAGSADSRITAVRDRYDIIRQALLRNDHFSPSTIPSKDHNRILTIRTTKQLLGRVGERFLLFGMLSYSVDGKPSLEDPYGRVELDFSRMDKSSEGFYTEGCFALVEGDYTEEEKFEVIAMGHPPCERREIARSIYGHIDFLGKGNQTPLEDNDLDERLIRELPDLMLHCLSDVWLDHPDTFAGLQSIFAKCQETRAIPRAFIFCGNFTSKNITQGNSKDMQTYSDNFDRLADLISSYSEISRKCHFVFVPGPLDITANSILPRRPILSSFVGKLKQRLPKAHFMSNPCRIKCFGQEIVIFRDDIMARILRNTMGVKVDVQDDTLKKYLVQTIIDQVHLVPLSRNIQPVLSEFDHSLRLYPMPSTVILADKYEGYELTYEGCHVFNPGSFVGSSFGFSTYFPARRRSECSFVEPEDE